jgi:hypothetical protein
MCKRERNSLRMEWHINYILKYRVLQNSRRKSQQWRREIFLISVCCCLLLGWREHNRRYWTFAVILVGECNKHGRSLQHHKRTESTNIHFARRIILVLTQTFYVKWSEVSYGESWGQKWHVHWGDLILRELDCIVTVSFGVYLVCGYLKWFCNVWVCLSVSFVMWGCVCMCVWVL